MSITLTAISNGDSLDATIVQNNFTTISNKFDAGITNADISSAAAIVLSKLASSAFSTYTPTWTGASANPSIGNGTLTGYYVKIGRLAVVHIIIAAGSSTNEGTGAWFLTTPYNVDTDYGNTVCGIATYYDSSASAFYTGIVTINETGGSSKVQARTSNAAPSTVWGSGAPVTIGTDDKVSLLFFFETAS